jgi:hypothetical protein
MATTKPRAIIWIDADIHRNVKAVAAAKGISLKALAEQAMLEWCFMQPPAPGVPAVQAVQRAIIKLYGPATKGSDKKRTKPLAVRL